MNTQKKPASVNEERDRETALTILESIDHLSSPTQIREVLLMKFSDVLSTARREGEVEADAKAAVLRGALTEYTTAKNEGLLELQDKTLAALSKRLEDAERKAKELDHKLRKALWLRHGCSALYGDDGEMQCATCVLDFKRQPLDEIEATLHRKAIEAAAKDYP